MKFCTHCGGELADDAVICPSCGSAVPQTAPVKEDKRSVGLNIIGFLFPLIGLILYLCLKKETPNRAKSIGKWALIGFIIGVVLNIIIGVIGAKLGVDIANADMDQVQQDPTVLTDDTSAAQRTFAFTDEGIAETMTFDCDGDVIVTITDTTYVDTTGATEDDIAMLQAQFDDSYLPLTALDFCSYTFTTEENQAVILVTYADLDNAENLAALEEIGFVDLDEEGTLLSMSVTAANMLADGWVEQ